MLTEVQSTPLSGLFTVCSSKREDSRGAFARLFCTAELASVLGGRGIAQINHSRTDAAGIVRGLHFQRPPHAEMKLVRCLRGRVFDVAVDLRSGSPTFLRWHAVVLAPEAANMIIIPEGFAHGFQALECGSELLYLHTAAYAPASEGGVAYNDGRLAITWPLPPQGLSQRDLHLPPLAAEFRGLSL